MLIPVGFIENRVQTDKWNNQVSLIHICSGETLRMVHHTSAYKTWQKATIYFGRGKSVKAKYNIHHDNPCVSTELEVAGYKISWGDGEVLSVSSNPSGINLDDLLKQIKEENISLAIVNIIASIMYDDKIWT